MVNVTVLSVQVGVTHPATGYIFQDFCVGCFPNLRPQDPCSIAHAFSNCDSHTHLRVHEEAEGIMHNLHCKAGVLQVPHCDLQRFSKASSRLCC